MQAIILAAGMGKRLGELTKNNTKCMVEVGGVRRIPSITYTIPVCPRMVNVALSDPG